ncbi:MAG: LPS export ABC transporter periplasmic protein LptC [Sneathiella sp.]|nr:LPS export ABC transporter periplasmic protein LptC [Sneathiella sp.]
MGWIPTPDQNPDRRSSHDAGRHSRFVSTMKFVLPVLALTLLALAFFIPAFEKDDTAISLEYQDVTVGDHKLTMSNPRFLSSDKDGQQYVVTAESATQIDITSKVIELTNLQADISLKNNRWISLSAPKGKLNPDLGILDLQGGIDIFSDSGDQIYTKSAHIKLKERVIETLDGLRGHGPMGEIEADSLVVDQLNGNIKFVGNVKMILYP